MKTIDPNNIFTKQLFPLLTAAVAPRPIAFASTIDKVGNVNLSPFSFFNVFGANPPMLIFSPSRRGRDGTTKHTYDNVKEVPEVVISMVNYSMVQQMSLASTEYDKGVNEFIKAGFTAVTSNKVLPPRVGEAPVSFECKVDRVIELGMEGGAGNLVLARIALIHIDEKYLDERGRLDTTALDLVGRMGGNWYCRASGDALFEVAKPLLKKGVGVDQLPESVRMSKVLSGNDLGKLGNQERLPTQEEIEMIKASENVKTLLGKNNSISAIHQYAKHLIEKDQLHEALCVLMMR